MKRKRLQAAFYLNAAAAVLLVGYKVYLTAFAEEPASIHAVNVERIQSALQQREAFSFAVVGNINNSIGIFERRIIPELNEAGIDFVVSAGNAVRSGGEDKFRALQRGLRRLEAPYLLTFGENESSGIGGFRFYRSFGPYFYSFTAGGARFVFLDSTGDTPYEWQLRWLDEELRAGDYEPTFVFLGHPLQPGKHELLFESGGARAESTRFRDTLIGLAERHGVDAVFSANRPVFERRDVGGVTYVTTGGAGGLMLDSEFSFHHYVTVTVQGDDLQISPQRLDSGQSPVLRTLESAWLFVHSLVYTGYLNFLLLLSVLAAVGIRLHALIFEAPDFGQRFELDIDPHRERPLKVAMFTNNYRPFVGGVPVAIERLCHGLRALGHQVMVIAPRYGSEPAEDGVYRLPSLLPVGSRREFRLANIFRPAAWRAVRAFGPELVHVHHPFWVGSLGLWIGKRLGVPVVSTYHTRLEHYAHYAPVPGLLFRNLLSHYLVRRFANKCDGVVVPTDWAEEYLRALGVRVPIAVQPTGVEASCFERPDADELDALRSELGIAEHERVLVSVSRLSREKNIEFMIGAMRLLGQQTGVPFRLLLIGDGVDRDELRRLAETEGLAGRVTLPGTVAPERMPLYYGLGDVFVFASRSETQGMVILEAMAAGLPVVAVRSSGIDDMVRNEVTGFKTAQDAAQWSGKAALLLNDDGLRARMAENAVEFARGFTVERAAEKMNDFYAYLLARRKRREAAA